MLTELRREDERADYRTWALEREVAPDMPWTDPISIPKFDHYQAYILKHPCFNSDSWFLVLKGNHIAGLNNLWKTPNKKVVTTGFTGVRRKYRRKGLATGLRIRTIIGFAPIMPTPIRVCSALIFGWASSLLPPGWYMIRSLKKKNESAPL